MTSRVIGPGGGGSMFNPTVSPHDKNTVLVSCDMTGAYITHDGGQSWRMFNLRGTVRFFAFDPICSQDDVQPKSLDYGAVRTVARPGVSFIQARRRSAAFAWIPITLMKPSLPIRTPWGISLLWRLTRWIRERSMQPRRRTGNLRCLHRGISERRGAVKRACRKLLAISGLIDDLRSNPARYIPPARLHCSMEKKRRTSALPHAWFVYLRFDGLCS